MIHRFITTTKLKRSNYTFAIYIICYHTTTFCQEITSSNQLAAVWQQLASYCPGWCFILAAMSESLKHDGHITPKRKASIQSQPAASSTSICHSGTELFWTSERIRLFRQAQLVLVLICCWPALCLHCTVVLLHFEDLLGSSYSLFTSGPAGEQLLHKHNDHRRIGASL